MMARVRTEKVASYVIDGSRLLVFTHLDRPLTVTGVQVRAGTIGADESAADAGGPRDIGRDGPAREGSS